MSVAPRRVSLRAPLTGEQIVLLNEVLRDTADALAHGLTFGDNMNARVVTARFATGNLPVFLSHGLDTIPKGLQLWAATPVQGDGTRQSGNRVTWSAAGADKIQITAVDDLTAGVLYDVTFLLLGG